MLVMSAEDKSRVRTLREAGVLEDVDAHRLHQAEGAILITCADGDQMHDIFQRAEQFQADQRAVPRIHLLSLNGGALLLPFRSRLSSATHEDIVFLRHIKEARQMKGMKTIALYAHAPCGAATKYKLGVYECVELLIYAKRRLKDEFRNDVTVACFLHVDKGLGDDGTPNKRTYFVSPTKWREWMGPAAL